MRKIISWIVTIIAFFWILGWITDLSNIKTASPTDKKDNIENNETKSIIIKRADFKDWPFTVENGKLWCDGSKIFFATNGNVYGINGAGKSYIKKNGGAELSEIWAIDIKTQKELMALGLTEEKATVRLSIQPILNKGLSLCKNK